MITPLDFLFDLFNPSLAFLPRALAAVTLASLVTGVVGCHVMMRGMVFIGDAVAHSVFPGLAVAFVIGGNLVFGGLIAGVITAVLVAIFSQNQKLREDSVIRYFLCRFVRVGYCDYFAGTGVFGVDSGFPVRFDCGGFTRRYCPGGGYVRRDSAASVAVSSAAGDGEPGS